MSPNLSPLHDFHLQAGAKLVDFHGWMLPVQYSSVLQEHKAVREHAGVFDVSHMGEFQITGRGACEALNSVIAGHCLNLEIGQCLYSPLCNYEGGTVDDLIVYRLAEETFMLVVNGANIQKDFDWLRRHLPDSIELEDQSAQTALIAVQGPQSAHILKSHLAGAHKLRSYRFDYAELDGETVLLSRTGYTGEDGFEIYGSGPSLLNLLKTLVEDGVTPCGLGARDTLRLEARLPLYGQELSEGINPVEAGLKRFLDLDGPPWIGQQACSAMAQSPSRKLMGIQLEDRQAARTGTAVYRGGEWIGEVTSGSYLPTVGASCSLVLLKAGSVKIRSAVEVELRNRRKPARVVRLPFYKREK